MRTFAASARRPLTMLRRTIRFTVSMKRSPVSNAIRPKSRGAKRRAIVFRVTARPIPIVDLWVRTVRNATTKAAGNRLASITMRRSTRSRARMKRRAVAVVMWPEGMRARQRIVSRAMRLTIPTPETLAHSVSIAMIPGPGVAADLITERRVAFRSVAPMKRRVVTPAIGSRRVNGSFPNRAQAVMRVTMSTPNASARNARPATLRRVGRKLPSIMLRRRSFLCSVLIRRRRVTPVMPVV